MDQDFDVQLHTCYCIDCGNYFMSINDMLRRCDKCELEKYGPDPYADVNKTEDSDTLEEALADAEADLIRANERIDLLLEILAALQKTHPVVGIPPQLSAPPLFPMYTTCNNGQQTEISPS